MEFRSNAFRRITGYLVGTLDKWNDAKRGGRARSCQA